jgi:hypothetical protein
MWNPFQRKRKEHTSSHDRSGSPEDIIGLVGVEGVAGTWSQGNTFWTIVFFLPAWKPVEGTIQRTALRVERKATKQEMESFRESLRAYDIVRLRVWLLEESVLGTRTADCMELLEVGATDAELQEEAKKLQEPVTFEDSQFGVFTLDRRVNWFNAETTWLSMNVQLALPVDEDGTVQLPLAHARTLWHSQEVWTRRIQDFAASRLLAVKNESWLGEGEKAVTADKFKARMTLQSVTVNADGSFEFWHDDGGLFCGHNILVSGSIAEGPCDADIPG